MMPNQLGDDTASSSRGSSRQRLLERLYRDHAANLVDWLRRRYGGGPPSPEDIAQTAFTKLASHSDIQHIEKIKPYLYATAVNVALDEIKWMKRTEAFIDHELNRIGQALEEITPERVYQGREQLDRLARVMERLPKKQREIVKRSRFLGQTYAQISAETGWSGADISRQLGEAMIAIQAGIATVSTEDK
ncbi:RNA polymerase sigma factor [Sphingobium sp. AN558]|uniref:RNA polymerase sigma factor n=1 Tax=Sphingobium sp. AN558 TaxID=3133442 RepID=UPI0030C230AD